MASSSSQPISRPDIEAALSTEDVAPRYLHPKQEVSFVQKLLATGPPSPRSARSFLEVHGADLSVEDAVALAKKLAQLAEDRETATNLRVRHLTDLARVASQEYLEQTHKMENALASLKE